MTTYDVHQHLWPESFVAALAERTSPPLIRSHTLVLEHEGEFELDPAVYGTEACIADELIARGVAAHNIVLAFQHPRMRERFAAG